MSQDEVIQSYNAKYQIPNYFRDRRWLYRAFVRTIIKHAQLNPGARVLDAGCGQGMFTSLFAENGMAATGVDISEVGVASATKAYAHTGAQFESGDIRQLRWRDEFDCVFTRSCSLYNSLCFESDHELTETLFAHVKRGGVFVFDYHTKLNPRKESREWIYHSLCDVNTHFARYAGAEVFFSVRLESLLCWRGGFTSGSSCFSVGVSRWTGMGGELLAFVRKK